VAGEAKADRRVAAADATPAEALVEKHVTSSGTHFRDDHNFNGGAGFHMGVVRVYAHYDTDLLFADIKP
jgi:hypothetical protein